MKTILAGLTSLVFLVALSGFATAQHRSHPGHPGSYHNNYRPGYLYGGYNSGVAPGWYGMYNGFPRFTYPYQNPYLYNGYNNYNYRWNYPYGYGLGW